MRVLIYEPLPDMNRAPIIAQLAKTLMADGHEVLVVIEEKLIYTLLGKLTHQGVINCSRTWRRHIATDPKIKVCTLKTPPGLYWFVNASNFSDRLAKISELRKEHYSKLLTSFNPEKIFVWNGQHEHLQDFMMLSKQTHEGKFVYMECGWFPQKGTIYFDTEGVNAASSIAKLPTRTLTPSEHQQLQQWLASYTPTSAEKMVPKLVFVPLQVDTDTNISVYSPFKNMQELILFLERWLPPEYSAVLRPHPLQRAENEPPQLRENFHIDSKTEIRALIDRSEIVIGINSTVLLEAIARGRPVICFGEGFLSKTNIELPFSQSVRNTMGNCQHMIYELAIKAQDSTASCLKATSFVHTKNISECL